MLAVPQFAEKYLADPSPTFAVAGIFRFFAIILVFKGCVFIMGI